MNFIVENLQAFFLITTAFTVGVLYLLSKKSEQFYRIVLSILPRNAWAHYYYGEFLNDKPGRLAQAENEFKKAITYQPDFVQAYYRLLPVLADQESREDEFEKLCHGLLEIQPHNLMAYIGLGLVCHMREQYPEAEKYYQEAIQSDPRFTFAYQYYAELLIAQDRYLEAKHILRKLIELDTRNTLYQSNLAFVLYQFKEFSEAETIYRKLVKNNPGDTDANIKLALLLRDQNRQDESEEVFRKAIAIDPSSYQFYDIFGNSYFTSEKYSEVVRSYQQAIRLNPEAKYAYLNLGMILHEHLDQIDEAEQAYRRALELGLQNATGYFQLGWLLLEHRKNYQEAEMLFLKTLELDPIDETALYNLACIKSQTQESQSVLVI